MKLWHWRKTGPEQSHSFLLHADKPTLIICGGGFNVDDPSLALHEPDQAVEKFFDFIVNYVNTDKDTFKRLICGTLRGKQDLNYFIIRKLLGMISAVPGNPLYPATLDAGYSDAIDIFEVSFTSTAQCFNDTQALYHSADYYSNDAMELVQTVFGPLITDTKDSRILCSQLQNITLFGISHGSNFLMEVENALYTLFKESGFDEAACSEILKQIVAIAISSIAPVTVAQGPRFTSIYFEGINDRLAEWINPYKSKVSDFAIRELADNRLLILSYIVESAVEWQEVLPQFDYFWIDNDKAAHYTPFYTMRCKPENIQPEMVERVLRNAVGRKEKPLAGVRDLLLPALPLSASLRD